MNYNVRNIVTIAKLVSPPHRAKLAYLLFIKKDLTKLFFLGILIKRPKGSNIDYRVNFTGDLK